MIDYKLFALPVMLDAYINVCHENACSFLSYLDKLTRHVVIVNDMSDEQIIDFVRTQAGRYWGSMIVHEKRRVDCSDVKDYTTLWRLSLIRYYTLQYINN